MQTTQRNREDIPEEYKWRMEDIYPDPAAWEQDLAALLPMGEEIAAYAGRLGEEEALVSCLLLDEKLSMRLEKVYGYAHMLQDLDNASPAAQSMQERALALLFRLQEMTAFLLPELTALDPVRLREVAERRPELRDFRHMIDNVIRSRAHVLSAREEQLLAMAAPALESMDNAFSMLDSVDLDRGEVEDEDGNRVKLTDGLFARMRESRDRRVRADAFAALHGAFYGGAQGGVRGQPGGVQLGVAARQVKPADVIRQRRVGQRAKKAQLRAVFPQCLQRFGVGKAERGVPCHGKAHPRRGHRARHCGGRGAVKQGVQQRPVDGLLRGIG